VACGGIGSPATVWIGLVLMVFHAVSKSLLFLVVGTVENRFYTKDMENYDNLIVKMPVTALLFVCGIAGMFIAPFGVVVSKWAAIEAFLNIPSAFGGVLVIMLAYGSGATVFYWSKLLGKILSMRDQPGTEKKREETIGNDEWVAEWSHAGLSLAVCAGLPLLSAWLVEPYVRLQYGVSSGLGPFNYGVIICLLFLLVALPALAYALHRRAAYRLSDTYVCGRQMDAHLLVGGALGSWREITLKNYYLDDFFNSGAILRYSNVFCGVTILFMLAAGVIWGR
jgi:ech hydrogenase subunit A